MKTYIAYILWFSIVGTLKLMGYVSWSWFWIWSPVWIPVFALGLVFTIIFIMVGQKGKGYDKTDKNNVRNKK